MQTERGAVLPWLPLRELYLGVDDMPRVLCTVDGNTGEEVAEALYGCFQEQLAVSERRGREHRHFGHLRRSPEILKKNLWTIP